MEIKQYKAEIVDSKGKKTGKFVTGGIVTIYKQEAGGKRRLVEFYLICFVEKDNPRIAYIDVNSIVETNSLDTKA